MNDADDNALCDGSGSCGKKQRGFLRERDYKKIVLAYNLTLIDMH